MTTPKFFEQLAMQLGVGRVETSGQKKKNSRPAKVIVPRADLTPAQTALWFLFRDVRNRFYHTYQPEVPTRITSEHIQFIRQAAHTSNFASQREELLAGRRPKFLAIEDAWDTWQDIFEEFVRDFRLEPSPTK